MVDHINRIKSDDRLINLRLATRSQNFANNSRIYRGVYKYANKWKAQLGHNGKIHYFGLYNTKEEAYAVVCREHKKLHGEFSSCE